MGRIPSALLQAGFQKVAHIRRLQCSDLLRGASGNKFSAFMAAFMAKVDDVVGRLDDAVQQIDHGTLLRCVSKNFARRRDAHGVSQAP